MAFIPRKKISKSSTCSNWLKTFYIIYSMIVFCGMLLVIERLRPIDENDTLTARDVSDGSLNNSSQNDPRILRYIRKFHLRRPSKGEYNLIPTIPIINSLWKDAVSKYVFKNVLKNKTDGFFIESGANNGEFLSNTLSLELKYNWTGLLVEADPNALNILVKRNRKAWIADVCLGTESYPYLVISARVIEGSVGPLKEFLISKGYRVHKLIRGSFHKGFDLCS